MAAGGSGYSRPMLIAEEFVLLALDDDGTPARGTMNQSAAEIGVTGALLIELVLQGHVTLDGGRIGLTGTRPDHPMLAKALDNTEPHEGKKLKNRLGSITHAGWSEVVDAMVADGVVGREKHTLRPTRHPVADQAAHAALLSEVRTAAQGSGPLTDRLAALLALAGPCQMLEVVAPDRSDRKRAKERIDTAADQIPAASAVKYVIESAAAAVVVAASVSAST